MEDALDSKSNTWKGVRVQVSPSARIVPRMEEGDTQMVSPGDHAEVNIELLKPVGIKPGMRFAVREGGKTVGSGVVLTVS